MVGNTAETWDGRVTFWRRGTASHVSTSGKRGAYPCAYGLFASVQESRREEAEKCSGFDEAQEEEEDHAGGELKTATRASG